MHNSKLLLKTAFSALMLGTMAVSAGIAADNGRVGVSVSDFGTPVTPPAQSSEVGSASASKASEPDAAAIPPTDVPNTSGDKVTPAKNLVGSQTATGTTSSTSANSTLDPASASNSVTTKEAPLAPFTRPPSPTLADKAGGNQYLRQVSTLIPNVRVTDEHVVRGAQPTAQALSVLKQGGVTTVINLRNEESLVAQEGTIAERLGLKYISIPMNVFDVPSKQQIKAFLSAVDKAKGKVYVHCLHGEDRTGTMIGIYRIAHDGWNGTRAYQEMVSYGFKPFLNNLATAVFDYSAAEGRPVQRPSANFILTDLYSRIQKYIP